MNFLKTKIMSKNPNPEETGAFHYKFDIVNEIKYLGQLSLWRTDRKQKSTIELLCVLVKFWSSKHIFKGKS